MNEKELILRTKEEKEAFFATLPTVKHGFVDICPRCGAKYTLPYVCAGKGLQCTCGFTHQIRELTEKELRKKFIYGNKDFLCMSIAVLSILFCIILLTR